MNSLETDYSFLAPTWKLPSIGTYAKYTGATSPSALKFNPNESNWNNAMHDSRYIPPNMSRQSHPQTTNQHPGKHSMQSGPSLHRNNEHPNDNLDLNEQYDNRGLNYPPPTRKRVQIIDHNRKTPSVDPISGRNSHDSYTPDFNEKQNKSKSHDNRSDSTHGGVQRPNNFNVHDYLYGLAVPDPGSYVSAYKNHRRRLEDDKVNPKAALNTYKTFVQNGGFGPAFGNAEFKTYEEKVDTEKKRKSYSKVVRETNQYKVEAHKRIQNNGGQQRNRTQVVPLPKHRRPEEMRSHFLTSQEVRDFEQRIKREHDANCRCSLHANPQHSSA